MKNLNKVNWMRTFNSLERLSPYSELENVVGEDKYANRYSGVALIEDNDIVSVENIVLESPNVETALYLKNRQTDLIRFFNQNYLKFLKGDSMTLDLEGITKKALDLYGGKMRNYAGLFNAYGAYFELISNMN